MTSHWSTYPSESPLTFDTLYWPVMVQTRWEPRGPAAHGPDYAESYSHASARRREHCHTGRPPKRARQ